MTTSKLVGLMLLGSASLIATAVIANPVAEGGRKFTTAMTGAAEVPGPGDPDGTGTANIVLNHGQSRVCFEISVSNIATPTAAHIHDAPVGVAGGVVVPLFTSSGVPLSGCTEGVNRDLIKDIIQNPDEYYVNVHNAEFPAGAVRGQLSK